MHFRDWCLTPSGRRRLSGLRALVTTAAMLGALLATSFAANASSAARAVAFSTPSGNIGCIYFKPTLRCDIRNGLSPKAGRPPGCPSYTDWGQGLTLSPAGTHVVCAGDTALGAPNKLPYGHVWRRDGLTCWSRVTGLTCENARGRGFFLSRESWRRF